MTDIADLVLYVAPHVMGCPDPLIERAIVQAARRLCDRSLIWTQEEEILPAVATVKNIQFDVSTSNTEIKTIDYVKFNDDPLFEISEPSLNAIASTWSADTGEPSHYIPNIKDKTARLYPIPNTTDSDAITYKVTLRPAMAATELPDFMAEDYLDALIDGALAELMSMNRENWADPLEAERRRKEFKKGIWRARADKVATNATHRSQTTSSTLV